LVISLIEKERCIKSLSKISRYLPPPCPKNFEGKPRRAGFEIEFGNVGVAEAAEIISKHFEGRFSEKNPFKFLIEDSPIGDIRIERDAELLHKAAYRDILEKLSISFDKDSLANQLEEGVDDLAKYLIPCEIVTDPLPVKQFEALDKIADLLDSIAAQGTQDSPLNAFGVHINPDTPSLEADCVRRFLQAFVLLADWIVDDSGTDFSRRVFTSFIDPFPEDYLNLILTENYAPDMAALIDDYLEHNPTRNRSLDMLPLFAFIDEKKVMAGIKSQEKSLIKKRPAYHYRLPDCRIGEEGWGIATEWNRWWCVEALANDDVLLNKLIGKWQSCQDTFFFVKDKHWQGEVEAVIEDLVAPVISQQK